MVFNRMAKVQNTDDTKCLWGCRATEMLVYCWQECKIVWPHWKTVWGFSTKLNMLLPYDPAIMIFGIYTNELKNYVHKKLHNHEYSSLIHNCQNLQVTKMTFGEWTHKLCYIQTRKYYSALKTSELSRHKKTWRKIKCVLLNEKNKIERLDLQCDSSYMSLWKRQIYGDSKRSVISRDWEERGMNGRSQRIFKAVRIVHMILKWWTYIVIHLSQPLECTPPQVNANADSGLWVIMMRQCKFITILPHPLPLVGELVMGRLYM